MQQTFGYKNPKDYLINISEQLKDDLKCGVCFQFTLKPYQCAGPCHKIICSSCYSEWRSQKNQCPSRCSQQPYTIKLYNISLQFKCPFDQQCKKPIKSLKEFNNHYKLCNYLGIKDNKQVKYRQNYKCKKGHPLQTYSGSIQQLCSQCVCGYCKQKKPGVFKCRKCDQMYCNQCRKPNYSKISCPQGHSYKKIQNINDVYFDCNICGGQPITGQGYFHDPVCLHDICSQCYKDLPLNCSQVKYQINNSQKCLNNHQLQILKEKLEKVCKLCQKQKLCIKYCKQCMSFFCLQCKVVMVDQKSRCPKKHEFKNFVLNQQKEIKCMRCQIKIDHSYKLDNQCHILICEKCFQYSQKVQEYNKRYLLKVECNNGHNLRLLSSVQEIIFQCFQCFQQKPIKVACLYCFHGICFCVQCKPPQNANKCYLNHILTKRQDQSQSCQICDSSKKICECIQCDYRICQDCKEMLQSRIELQQLKWQKKMDEQ